MYNLSCVLLFVILLCSYFFLIIMFLCILKHGSDGKELSKEALDLTLLGIMKKKKKTSNLVRKIVQLDNFLKTFPVADEWSWVGLHPITILTVKDLELCIDFLFYFFPFKVENISEIYFLINFLLCSTTISLEVELIQRI